MLFEKEFFGILKRTKEKVNFKEAPEDFNAETSKLPF